jgi:FMN phosphatase YigB (HAD superfamily)
MISKPPIRCILFDLGSTLWTKKDKATLHRLEHASNRRAVEVLLRHYNISGAVPTFATTTLVGYHLRKTVEMQIQSKIRQNPEHEPDFTLATIEALDKLGVSSVHRSVGDAVYEALRVRIPESRSLFEDTLFTLTALQRRGYILGIVTNRHWGGQPFREDLEKIGLLDYFDQRFLAVSADLGMRKPGSAIFLHALQGLNVLPEEAAMVGDSFRADIVGAKKLNIFAIWKAKSPSRKKGKVALMPISSEEVQQHPNVSKSANASAELSSALLNTEDDFILAYSQRHEVDPSDLKPDVTIEHLSDLLDIFVEAQ